MPILARAPPFEDPPIEYPLFEDPPFMTGAWAVLACVPLVAYEHEEFPPGADVKLSLDEPPFVSLITVSRRINPDVTGFTDPYVTVLDPSSFTTDYPYITAADPSGRLLIYVARGRAADPEPDVAVDPRRDSVHAYFLCDAHTGAASRLPDPPADKPLLHFQNVGLIADPRRAGVKAADRHYMVAELQPFAGTSHASLLCYSTETGAWVAKELAYDPNHPKRGNDGVISHDGRLWWVDHSYGLFACDPFAEQPELLYVPLPQGCMQPAASGAEDIDKRRFVKLSAGKLRYVQIDGPTDREVLTMWTLHDPAAVGGAQWRHEYKVRIVEIFADRNPMATQMERKGVPELALVDLNNPYVIYFFQNGCFLGFDMQARKIVEWEVFEMTFPPIARYSSFFVHAWKLPPTLPRRRLPKLHDWWSSSSSSDEDPEDFFYLRRMESRRRRSVFG